MSTVTPPCVVTPPRVVAVPVYHRLSDDGVLGAALLDKPAEGAYSTGTVNVPVPCVILAKDADNGFMRKALEVAGLRAFLKRATGDFHVLPLTASALEIKTAMAAPAPAPATAPAPAPAPARVSGCAAGCCPTPTPAPAPVPTPAEKDKVIRPNDPDVFVFTVPEFKDLETGLVGPVKPAGAHKETSAVVRLPRVIGEGAMYAAGVAEALAANGLSAICARRGDTAFIIVRDDTTADEIARLAAAYDVVLF